MDTAQGRRATPLNTRRRGRRRVLLGPAENRSPSGRLDSSYVDRHDGFLAPPARALSGATRVASPAEPGYFRHVSPRRPNHGGAGAQAADYAHVIFHQPNTKFPLKAGRELGFQA